MTLVIIGVDGQVGTDLHKLLPQAVGLTINDLNVVDVPQARALLMKLMPSIVINTAAYHQVDDCEDNREKAFQVNAQGAQNIAKICQGRHYTANNTEFF